MGFCPRTRPPRGGGQEGTMTPGPMGFRKAVGFRGPMSSRGAHRNDTEKSACGPEDFFFGDHPISTGKTVRISVKTFFFGDHITIRTKLWHFLRLFWSLQNRKSVIVELPPGPRSAFGAPVREFGVLL